MALGDLLIKLSADTAQFQSDVGKAAHSVERARLQMERSLNNIKTAVAGLGIAALLASQFNKAQAILESVDKLTDVADKTGASVEQLSRLQQVARVTGESFEGIEGGLIKLNKALNTASDDTNDARRALTAIGLSFDELKGKDPAVAMQAIADAMNKFEDSGSKTAVALALFGKQGAALLPFLKDWATYGKGAAVVTTEQADATAKLHNELRRFSVESENAKRAILLDLVGPMNNAVEQFREGKRIFGGVFGGIMGAGTINPFREVGENLRAARADLDDLEKARALQVAATPGFVTAGIDADIAKTRQQIEFLKVLQRQQAAALTGGNTPGEKARFFQPQSIDFTLGDKADAFKQKAEDVNALVLKLNRQAAESQLSIDKEVLSQRMAALDAYQAAEILSLRDYYQLRGGIVQAGLAQETADLDAQIELQRQNIVRVRAEAQAAVAAGKAAFSKGDIKDAGEQQARVIELNKQIVDGETQILKLQGERQKLAVNVSGQLATQALREQAAVDALRDSYERVNTEILKLTGKATEAAAAEFDAQNKKLRDTLRLNNDIVPGGEAALGRLRELTLAQAQFNQLREDYTRIQEELQTGEQRIQNALRTSALGELEALNRTGALRKQAVADQAAIVEKMQQLAAATGDDKMRVAVDSLAASVGKLRSESDLLADKLNSVFGDSVSGPLVDFISGTKSAKDAFNDFTKSLLRNLNEIAVKQISSQIFGQSGSGGFNPGGLLAGLFNGSLFGFRGASGAAGGAASVGGDAFAGASGAVGGDAFAGVTGLVGAFADGTDYVPRTGLALVHQGERIVPASENRAGGGGLSVVNNITISGPVDRRTMSQIQAAAGLGVQRALARNT